MGTGGKVLRNCEKKSCVALSFLIWGVLASALVSFLFCLSVDAEAFFFIHGSLFLFLHSLTLSVFVWSGWHISCNLVFLSFSFSVLSLSTNQKFLFVVNVVSIASRRRI